MGKTLVILDMPLFYYLIYMSKNLLTRLSAMQLMACSCAITILNPNLLFIIALKHIMHTWISSVVSPIFSLVECRKSLDIRGPSKSDFPDFFEDKVNLLEPKVELFPLRERLQSS